MLCAIAPSESIEFGQHLSEVLGVFPAKVHLLNLSATAPYATFSGRPVDDRVLIQHLVLGRYDEDAGTNDAVGGHPERVVNARARADSVAVANGGRFNTCNRA